MPVSYDPKHSRAVEQADSGWKFVPVPAIPNYACQHYHDSQQLAEACWHLFLQKQDGVFEL